MNFADIIGNTEVKEYLLKTIETDNILHSYLFLGTSGIGKKIIAKEFAKKILCTENKDNCTCKSCTCFESGNHTDFTVINEVGENIKIDEIRKITEKVIEKPIISSKKVYIINDCEKMTREAQNCLLKTLEEPPEFIVIILISSNENLILNTIKSRCMKVQFKNISEEYLKKYAIEIETYTDKNITGYKLERTEKLPLTISPVVEENVIKIFYEKANYEYTVQNLENNDIIDIILEGKILYDKDNIFEILDYLIVCLYSKTKENAKYIFCIEEVNKAKNNLRGNANFDMTLDTMLFKMWEDVNENCYRN